MKTITLPSELEQALEKQAQLQGTTVELLAVDRLSGLFLMPSNSQQINGFKDRAEHLSGQQRPNTMIRQGMFPELATLSEEDFKIAEFHGDPDDGLNWNL